MRSGAPWDLELRRSASHEAGHAVVSVHLAEPFEYVTIRSSREYDGGLQPVADRQAENFRISEIARHQVVIAYAGSASQRILHPEQPPIEVDYCSGSDLQKIQNIMRECALNKDDLLNAKTEAESLVMQLRKVIEAVADSLLRKETLGYDEVKAIYTTLRT